MEPYDVDALPADPFQLFEDWHQEAEACDQIRYAAAMCLSTAGDDGFPAGRMVMMQAVDAQGVTFCTDRRSPKGRALEREPKAGLTFYWGPLERQVRLEGEVEEAPDEQAARFFQRRPRRSQVTAWASRQSQPVAGREELEQQMDRVQQRFEGREVLPRPPYWKAYRVRPRRIEFWEARSRRLHDRFLYRLQPSGEWSCQRLSP